MPVVTCSRVSGTLSELATSLTTNVRPEARMWSGSVFHPCMNRSRSAERKASPIYFVFSILELGALFFHSALRKSHSSHYRSPPGFRSLVRLRTVASESFGSIAATSMRTWIKSYFSCMCSGKGCFMSNSARKTFGGSVLWGGKRDEDISKPSSLASGYVGWRRSKNLAVPVPISIIRGACGRVTEGCRMYPIFLSIITRR